MIFALIGSLAAGAAILAVLAFALTTRPVTSDDWFDLFDENDMP